MDSNFIFVFEDYREYLKTKIEENKLIRGYQSKLATAAGCQRSILSQTVKGKMDLSRDQAAGLRRPR